MGIGRWVARGACWTFVAAVVGVPLAQPGGLLGADLALAGGALTVTGSVEGLAPGVPAQLRLTVHNDSGTDLEVERLRATVTSGGRRGCELAVEPWTGRLSVPAHGTAEQGLTVTLTAQDECAGLTWQLSYEALAAS